MAKLLRWTGYLLACVIGVAVLAAAVVWIISAIRLSARPTATPEQLAPPTIAQRADAQRLASTLGCFSCHGRELRGDKVFDEPSLGTIWAPNLTLIAAHASDEQLARAIRQGIGADGRSLFVMPSEAFQHLSDQEVAALIAMIRSIPARGSQSPHNRYGPLGRLGLVIGKFKTAPELVGEYAVQEPLAVGKQFEAGRRIAMTTCSGCHGPALEGKEAKPGESSPDLSIVGAYEMAAFQKLLRTGVPAGGRELPMMGPAARSDLAHLTDGEIQSLYAYLQARAQRVSR